ncbi:spore germination protein [Bacillus sp. WP8]|uniref:spore germination protein n=1 Tax=Bacillus sp. WP8 TaxID=756828 RepID=UPI0037C08CBF
MVMCFRTEVLGEGGVGVRRGMGERIGVIGGVIIGEGGVEGNIVSGLMVIIVWLRGVGELRGA